MSEPKVGPASRNDITNEGAEPTAMDESRRSPQEARRAEPKPGKDEEDVLTDRAKAASREAAARHQKQQPEKEALFVSASEEAVSFNIMVGRGRGDNIIGNRMSNGHVIWRVPVSLVEQFERHQFVKTGRIVRVDGR